MKTGESQQPDEIQQMFHNLHHNQRFVSSTSQFSYVANNPDDDDENAPILSTPKTPDRKRPITPAPSVAHSPMTKSPIRSARLVKKMKSNGNTNENLITILYGEIGLQQYVKAIETLESLSEGLENLNPTQLESIFKVIETLSDKLPPSDPAFERLISVFAKFLSIETAELDLNQLQDLNTKNKILLDRYKLEQAIANEDYEKATDLFIKLSSKGENAREVFSDSEIIHFHTLLTSKTASTEKSYRLSELQDIMGECMKCAQEMQDSIITDFSRLDVQESYYFYQALLAQKNNQPLEEVNALLMAIAKAGDRLAQENEEPEDQQQIAIRIHEYLARVQPLIEKCAHSDEFLMDELSVLRQNLQDGFREIDPSRRTANDWKMLPYNEYGSETWTLLYNAGLQEINVDAETSLQRTQAFILLMECDTVSHPAVCFLRIMSLYQQLFNLCQKSSDNQLQFDLMMQKLEKLSKAIESNPNIDPASKQLLTETQKTFLTNFKPKVQTSESRGSRSNQQQTDTASTTSNTSQANRI